MTTDELIQLLLSKMDSFETKLNGAIADIKQLKSDVTEIKADISEIKSDVQYLKRQDDVDTQTINGAYNGIKEVNSKLDKVIADQQLDRRATQATIAQLQSQVGTVEDRLDKAS